MLERLGRSRRPDVDQAGVGVELTHTRYEEVMVRNLPRRLSCPNSYVESLSLLEVITMHRQLLGQS